MSEYTPTTADEDAENTAPWENGGCFGHCDPEGWYAPCREYMATTESIRGIIAWRRKFARDRMTPEAFDRWLAAHDAEQRSHIAALEAVIQRVREARQWHPHAKKWFYPPSEIDAALSDSPSVVLAAHDREVAARAVESFAADLREWYPEDVFPKPSAENYHDLNVALARTNITLDRFSADLMRRAAGIATKYAEDLRSGSEGNEQ